MESITIGQIVSAITVLSVIGGFLFGIIKAVMNGYKRGVADRFDRMNQKIDKKFIEIDNRLDYVESKRDEYEAVAENSKFERKILMGGLLSALKGLKEMGCNDAVTHSIKEIEDYMMEKTHDQ